MSKTTPYAGPATADTQNSQPIEKRVTPYAGTLDVHSIFYTIQGEGPFCGVPAVFIRLAGCNLQCPWCDTEYTQGRQRLTPILIANRALELADPKTLVVITGGEPFRQDLKELTELLVSRRYFVQIETNGTLPPTINHLLVAQDTSARRGIYIVCSPKTGKVHKEVAATACCFKYVGSAGKLADDGLPLTALGHPANPRLARPPEGNQKPIYLQPADHKTPEANEANIRAVVESCMKYGYTVQLQIHKYLNME